MTYHHVNFFLWNQVTNSENNRDVNWVRKKFEMRGLMRGNYKLLTAILSIDGEFLKGKEIIF